MIFVSAGHYPSRPGAKYERFVEHDEASIWADQICGLITDSIRVPAGVLKEKVAFINSRVMSGDIAVEVHFNAAKDSDGNNVGRGCETLYYPGSENGKLLAERCQSTLAELFPPDRGIKEGWYRMNPDKGPDFFLAKTKCVAVILEPEFVHRSDIIIENRDGAMTELASILVTHYS